MNSIECLRLHVELLAALETSINGQGYLEGRVPPHINENNIVAGGKVQP